MTTRNARCVLLFSRSPLRDERLKRLPGAAAIFDLARARVADAVRGLADVDLVVIGDGPAPEGVAVLPQRGTSFGERLVNAFADAGGLGYRQVVAVPSDVPSLNAIALEEAFSALDAEGAAATVLGPSPDGGVYLIGISGDAASLLSGAIRWQTPHVARDLQTRALELGGAALVIEALPPLQDVDDRSDLLALLQAAGTDTLLRALLHGLLRGAAGRSGRAHAKSRVLALRSKAARGPPRSLLAA